MTFSQYILHVKFTDLETVWNENTAEFAVGLGFQK